MKRRVWWSVLIAAGVVACSEPVQPVASAGAGAAAVGGTMVTAGEASEPAEPGLDAGPGGSGGSGGQGGSSGGAGGAGGDAGADGDAGQVDDDASTALDAAEPEPEWMSVNCFVREDDGSVSLYSCDSSSEDDEGFVLTWYTRTAHTCSPTLPVETLPACPKGDPCYVSRGGSGSVPGTCGQPPPATTAGDGGST